MGRTVGASAEATRRRLVRAAADVFAARGYDGTRVSDIASAAGLSNGALYCYFTSRADLLISALRAHGRRPLADLVARFPTRSVADLLLQTGAALGRRQDPESYLAVEALIAARRHSEVADALRDYIGERADWLAALVREGQDRGDLDPSLPPRAVAHFCLALAAGTTLVSPDLHDVDDAEWADLLVRVVASLQPVTAIEDPAAEQIGTSV
ncbi:TetR/AcrR family transcriptional regulator [Blastococcus goldschmidtiae]|uniref:TetR/AcrR family transcriptional regulator n=1 Tax=Blastococcus goldschmidtiae TaxID=3075546 RepID=A0ABU2K8E2_9ACTN|nr:TetR/AcrR family transcriptional regulator [Blastococcus sp. DSM 46792]MDT0276433.1 TetR/AcrR family transcriptional regulator [Blastococcus sp. DSM 46792]